MYPVDDMSRAREFYEKTLELIPGSVSGGGAWVEYDLPKGGCFAITTFAEGVKPSSDAGGSVAFEVDDLHSLVEKLKAKNVEIKLDIFDTPVCEMAVILDSEGNALILHELKK